MIRLSLACLLLTSPFLASASPQSAAPSVELKCDPDSGVHPFGADPTQPERGKITVPAGTVMGSAIILADLIKGFANDYFCADCAIPGGCTMSSEGSAGVFIPVYVNTVGGEDNYTWSTSDAHIKISCTLCDD